MRKGQRQRSCLYNARQIDQAEDAWLTLTGLQRLTGQYHDHGYELAHHARQSRQARQEPVVSTIGNMLAVLDMQTMLGIFPRPSDPKRPAALQND